MTFFIFHLITQLKCHVTFWVGPLHPELAPYHVLRAMGLVNVETKRFWFVTWPWEWCVTWLCGWGSLILSYDSIKFGAHRPCERGDITILICHMTTISKWPCGWGPLVLSHQPAKFGVHRPWRYSIFDLSRGHVCVMWLCRWGLLVLCHHTAKFEVQILAKFYFWWIEKNSVKMKNSAKSQNWLKLLKVYWFYNTIIDLDTRDGILSVINCKKFSHF